MFRAILEIYYEVFGKNKLKFFTYIVVILSAAVCELMSLAAIIPLSASLLSSSPNGEGLSAPLVDFLENFFGVDSTIELGIVFVIFILASGILRTALVFVQAQIGKEVGIYTGSKLFNNLIINTNLYGANFYSGDVIAIVSTKLNDFINMVVTPTLVLLSSLFLIIIIGTFLIVVAPLLAFMSIMFFIICYLVAAFTVSPAIKKWSVDFSLNQNELIRVCQESIDGFADLKIYQLGDLYQSKFTQALTNLRRIIRNITVFSSLPKNIIETIILALFVSYIIILISLKLDVMNILPLLGAYALAAQRILPLMQQCYASWTSINGASRIIKDITKALKLENEAEKENEGNREEIGIDNFESIHLEGVCFGYKKDNGILDHLNLRINRGERIGIMGASGVGKSTLGAILLGLKKPSAGRVFVGGKNLDAKTVNAWFQNVAYVSQNVFIADVSISENIALGTKLDEIDHQKLEYCLKITQLNVFAEERDGSYHSSVGERGNTLSAGQKQRIAVARALYKGAEFIVFDEPTSSLDKITEMDFVEAMSALPKEITLVIISHREEIFSVCNKIYKLENKTLKAVRKI